MREREGFTVFITCLPIKEGAYLGRFERRSPDQHSEHTPLHFRRVEDVTPKDYRRITVTTHNLKGILFIQRYVKFSSKPTD